MGSGHKTVCFQEMNFIPCSKCFVSLVAKQMTYNMVVAMCIIRQMCFVGFSILSYYIYIYIYICESVIVIYSLSGHSAFSYVEFGHSSLRMQAKIKARTNQNHFFCTAHMHIRART